MANLNVTSEELETLEAALGEYMSDAYGDENAEGCWTPHQWTNLQKLAEKIQQAM